MTILDILHLDACHLVPVALGLFTIGVVGIILNNKNLLILMLSIELIFLGIWLFLLIISTSDIFFK